MSQNRNPIGAHISMAGGFLEAVRKAVAQGAEAVQVFAKSPMRAKLRAVTEEEYGSVKNFEKRGEIKSLVVHASYLLNFSKPLGPDAYEIESLVEDVFNAEALGGDGAVVHLGKSLAMPRDEAVGNYVKNIGEVIKKTDSLKSAVILENTAGQGTEIGFKLDELGEIYKKIGDKKRVKICLDTAHMFGAGYDLRTAAALKNVFEEVEKFIGVENIACVHFNDSKKPPASRVDRHEDIGRGTIGEDGLRDFVMGLRRLGGENIPLILETPEGFDSYEEQIKKVKSWF